MGGDTYAISGLVEKRRQLSGLIEHHKDQIKTVKADLLAIDAAIKIFDPEFDLRTIKPKGIRSINQWFTHGESTTLLMDLMREADKPPSTTQIVNEAASRKGYSFDDIDRKSFTASLFTTLKRFEDKGIARQTGKDGLAAIWELC